MIFRISLSVLILWQPISCCSVKIFIEIFSPCKAYQQKGWEGAEEGLNSQKRTEYKNTIIHAVQMKSWQLLFTNIADMVYIILKFRITAFSSVSHFTAGISCCQHPVIYKAVYGVKMLF